ncbi:MAG TPA: LeuA family protein [Gemmatimonadales bacterium]|nr:LeuA family protein [Gemmatimonadales bacterium]
MTAPDLVYDWNRRGTAFDYRTARVQLHDDTLRDGLQSPSAVDPPMDTKRRLLHLMAELGIESANLGFPAAGPHMTEQVEALAREIVAARLPLQAGAVARLRVEDVEAIALLAEATGCVLEVAAFAGASDVRMEAEGWTLDELLRMSEAAIGAAARLGLPVMFVVEDASRARPETLAALYGHAIAHGARRLCLTDTAGAATPGGVDRLVRFVRDEVIRPSGQAILLDWHGHRDRGLAIANCLAAVEAGVDRVHATALGVGERAGNAEMDILLANLAVLGAPRGDLTRLIDYCHLVAEALGLPIAYNYPVVGADAFTTAAGVHAAAVVKALEKGGEALADRVYSSLPAAEFGLVQRIVISPVSGHANVRYWLQQHGYDPTDHVLVEALLAEAKRHDRVLSINECYRVVTEALYRRETDSPALALPVAPSALESDEQP